MKQPYFRLKAACYACNVTMSVVGNLSPLLFLSFRELYGISYTMMGLLVLLNFCTQLAVDLVFSFFSHRFHIPKTVKFTPVLAAFGLLVYALLPWVLPKSLAIVGILIGTVIFSAASGLAEVLVSPVIAAIPADDPDREMSKLHSVYAWGVVGVVVVSTLFLRFVGRRYWQFLALFFALIPALSALLFSRVEIPEMKTPERASGALRLLKNSGLRLCVLGIFLGGAAECTMAQWASGFLEKSLGIPKLYGDLFGVAGFALMLGLGRSLYAKYGRNIERILIVSSVGATLCYLVCACSNSPIVGLAACALTGLCTAMLWPGNLVVASSRFPEGGIFVFAMMAAGGDLGASLVPQFVGVITDVTISSSFATALAQRFSLSAEQLGMKFGFLIGTLFPLMGILVYALILRRKKRDLAGL